MTASALWLSGRFSPAFVAAPGVAGALARRTRRAANDNRPLAEPLSCPRIAAGDLPRGNAPACPPESRSTAPAARREDSSAERRRQP